MAIVVALNILWSGGKLIRQSVGGLMDEGDPLLERKIRDILDRETSRLNLTYHQVRYRNAGTVVWVEFHLLFPSVTTLDQAHRSATEIEATVKSSLGARVNITTHLEPFEKHDRIHQELKASHG